MKHPDRPCCVRRQRWQDTEPIENLLPVRLQNFSSQSCWRSLRLIQHDGHDAPLCQSQCENGPTTSGTHHHNVCLFGHGSCSTFLFPIRKASLIVPHGEEPLTRFHGDCPISDVSIRSSLYRLPLVVWFIDPEVLISSSMTTCLRCMSPSCWFTRIGMPASCSVLKAMCCFSSCVRS